jgi:transposase
LVFDKGNNSRDNLELVARQGLHFVSSLVPGQHKDILAVPLASYREVNAMRWPKLLSYRTTKQVFGQERVVVTTFNPALWAGQMQGLNTQRTKIESALTALQTKLARWGQKPTPRGKRPTPPSVDRLVARILRGREPGPFLRHEATADANAVVQLSFHWDDTALQAMIDRHFGKTLLFSDRTDWSDEQIIAAYRSQAKIEDAFKQWKHPLFVSWRPLLHWTDQKVRVHAAYCTWALLLSALLLRQARRAGITTDLAGLLHSLAEIKTVIDLPRDDLHRRTAPVSIRLSRRQPDQQKLFDLLGLHRFQPEVTSTQTGATR